MSKLVNVGGLPVGRAHLTVAALEATAEQVDALREAGKPLSGVQAIEMIRRVAHEMHQLIAVPAQAVATSRASEKRAAAPKPRAATPRAVARIASVVRRVAKASKPAAAVKAASAKVKVKAVSGGNPVVVARKLASAKRKERRHRAKADAMETVRSSNATMARVPVAQAAPARTATGTGHRRPAGLRIRGLDFSTPATSQQPAVAPELSVFKDYLVCLEDGKRYSMLKRPLMTHFGMTMDDYRAKWGLPANYPKTAPGYSERKRQEAATLGLGHKTREFRDQKSAVRRQTVTA